MGCGFFKSREWGQREKKKCQRECLFSFSFHCVRPSPSFSPFPQSVNISATLYLSLCHSLKEEGKTHILLLLLPLQIFFSSPLSSQEVSHLPLRWLSGEAQWCWNSGRCTHWLGSTLMHVGFCKHALASTYTLAANTCRCAATQTDGPSVHTQSYT